MSLFRGTSSIGTGTVDADTTKLSLYDSASWNVYSFIGDNVTTLFTLGTDPAGKKNTQVYIDGVYQEKETYSLLTTSITFSQAPPNLSTIEVVVAEIMHRLYYF